MSDEKIQEMEGQGDISEEQLAQFASMLQGVFGNAQAESPKIVIYKNSNCDSFSVEKESKTIVYIGEEKTIQPNTSLEIPAPFYVDGDISLLFLSKYPFSTEQSFCQTRDDKIVLKNISTKDVTIKVGDKILTFLIIPTYLDFSEEELERINEGNVVESNSDVN